MAEKAEQIRQAELKRSMEHDRLDITLPGRRPVYGRYTVQTQTLREIYRVFGDMGFQIYRSPDVETDDNNFDLLNIPPHHPARDMQDTFYTTQPGVILRTQTSPGQIRAMREYCPEPIRVMLPGHVLPLRADRLPATRCSSTRWSCWRWIKASPLAT